MFSEKQIQFMKMLGIDVNFDNPNDDEYFQIEDTISDYLQTHGFDKNYEPTSIGTMCESILDVLSEM